MKFINKPSLITSFMALLLVACGSSEELNFGEKIQGQGAEVQEIGQQWSKGEKLIAKGNDLIESGRKEANEGESLVSKGESTVKKGEAMIREGNGLQAWAEDAYQLRNQNDIKEPL